MLSRDLLQRNRQGRLARRGSPFQRDVGAEVGQRPRQADADAELTLDVVGIEDVGGQPRVDRQAEPEAKDLQLGLPVQP